MFKTRLLSGIVLVAVLLGLFLAGGDILLCGLLLVSLIGMSELYRVFGVKGAMPVVAFLCTVGYYANMRFSDALPADLYFAGFLILLLAVYVFSYPQYQAKDLAAVFFGFFYVGLMLSGIYRLRLLPGGAYLVWLIMLCSWGCDTCAYCVGVLFGKHKMAPVLSPKKSIEGAVGGVVGAMLLCALFGSVFRKALGISTAEIGFLALIGGAGALLSMVGDLAASAIKRNFGIKDYGTLIPGHGGILDRFDSVIITAPVIYGLCKWIYG